MIDKVENYIRFMSETGNQDKILEFLDNVAEKGRPKRIEEYERGIGICWALSKHISHTSAYDFIFAHSDEYSDFDQVSFPVWNKGKWVGKALEFRMEWCRQLAEKLRNDPSLFLKLPAGWEKEDDK